MSLNERQRRHLRGLAHHLKPVVMIGQSGLSEAVLNETEIALDHHELIKIKVGSGDRATRQTMIQAIGERTGAENILVIGHMAVFFRPNPKKEKRLSLPV